MAEIVQLGELDDPYSTGLHSCVFAAQVRQFIGEVLTGNGPQRGRLSDALRPFENQAAIGLRPRSKDSRDGRDEPARADGASVVRIVGAEEGGQPSVQALNSIPMDALQVGLHGVKWMISRGRLDGLPGDLD